MARRKKGGGRSGKAKGPAKPSGSTGSVTESGAGGPESSEVSAEAGRGPRRFRLTGGVIAVALVIAALGLAGWWTWSRSGAQAGSSVSSKAVSDIDGSKRPGSALEKPPLPENLAELDPRMQASVREAAATVDRDPRNAEAWGQLGRVYHAHKYFDLARSCYVQARRLDPASAEWPYFLGLFAWERGDLDRAIELFRTVLRLDPDNLAARYRLGDALLREGELDRAESELQAYLDRAPEQSWGYLGLGRVARTRENWPEAAAHLEAARQKAPRHHEVLYLLAQTYRELGRDGEARQTLSALADAEQPSLPDSRLERVLQERSDLQRLIGAANRKLAEGDAEGAERLYREVLKFDPGHFDALFNLGVLHGRAERFPESIDALEGALVARPEHQRARFLLALAYANVGDIVSAKRELSEVLRRYPDDREASELMAQMPP